MIYLKQIGSMNHGIQSSARLHAQMESNVFPVEVQNVAMHYYNLFFLKKSFLNYDRETVLNTCMMIAAKVLNIHELQHKYLVQNQI